MAEAEPDMRSYAEKEREEANLECVAREVKARVQPTLPVNVDESSTQAFGALSSGKATLAVFRLERATETLFGELPSGASATNLAPVLPDAEPRYLVFQYTHDQNGSTTSPWIFVYFCPDKSPPFERMLYSTVKQNMIAYCNENDILLTKSIEASEKGDLTESGLRHELYPPKVEKKTFKKPARPGGRRGAGRKFQAPK